MSQAQRDVLTRLLSVMHGWEVGPRPHVLPKSRTLVMTEAHNRIVCYADRAFVIMWVSGDLPADTRLTFLCDCTDKIGGFQHARWGDVARNRAHFFASPLLLPSNSTLSVDSTNNGTISFHGMEVYRRNVLSSDHPIPPEPATTLSCAKDLVQALATLEEILVP